MGLKTESYGSCGCISISSFLVFWIVSWDAEHSPSQKAAYCISSDLLFLRHIDFYDLLIDLVVEGLRCYTWAFSGCGERELLSSCSACTSHCSGFSCTGSRVCGLQLLQRVGSAVIPWGLPGSGIRLVFLALQGDNHWNTRKAPQNYY